MPENSKLRGREIFSHQALFPRRKVYNGINPILQPSLFVRRQRVRGPSSPATNLFARFIPHWWPGFIPATAAVSFPAAAEALLERGVTYDAREGESHAGEACGAGLLAEPYHSHQ